MKRKAYLSSGFTLFELLVVIAILAIVATAGLYNWTAYRQALRLEQQAELTLTFLRRVQNNAWWHNDTHTVSVVQGADHWCLLNNTRDSTSCQPIRAGDFVPMFGDVQLVSVTSPTLAFHGMRNTAQAGHLVLMNGAGRVRLVISIWGRIRLCSEVNPVLAIPRC